MVDYGSLTHFAHELENILSRIRSGDLKITPGLINLLLTAVDLLKQFIEYTPEEAEEKIGQEVRNLIESISKFKGLKSSDPMSPQPDVNGIKDDFQEKVLQISMKFRPDLYGTGTDPLMLLRELDEAGEIIRIRCNSDSIPNLDKLKYDRLYLNWELILKTEKPVSSIENIFIFVRIRTRN